jgi:NAD(P)-dependent dehydrogenase (short-subunit alcohol dehydrogenase family)
LTLGALGAEVLLVARNSAQLVEVKTEIEGRGGRALAIATDISKDQEIDSLFAKVRRELHGLDILINNAGIGLFGKLVDFPVDGFDKIMAVNLRATFLCCQEALRIMIPARKGHIINISSVQGVRAYANQSAYAASKHGVMGLTKALSSEAQEFGIRVSAILPGGVDTELIKAARPDLDSADLVSPEDISQAVAFLLSLSDRAMVDQIIVRRSASSPFP